MTAYIFLGLATLCAASRLILRKYIFSALTTLFCLCSVVSSAAPARAWVVCALAFSIVGDFFMNREGGFLFGVAGFFAAHICFLIYCAKTAERITPVAAIVCAVMIAGYALFLVKGVFPREHDNVIRAALSLYALVSICVFSLSLCAPMNAGGILFSVGIFMIVFSDTLIGLSRYFGSALAGAWVLPTYYLCHLLVTLSMILKSSQ